MALGAQSAVLKACDFGDAVWQADHLAVRTADVVRSGHALLDVHLPGGGWPLGALCEVLQTHSAQAEWRLLLPALRAAQSSANPSLSAAWVALVSPPQTPFGPALAAQGLDVSRLLCIKANTPSERLWATEQVLRCADVAAVLAWLPQVQTGALRRLHMSAASHAKLLFVMRPSTAQYESSPAVLRLLLNQPAPLRRVVDALAAGDVHIQLLKRRGPPLTQSLVLPATGSSYALDSIAA
jgi:protein ImuA